MNRREFGQASLGALTASLAGCGQLARTLGGETDSTPMLESWESFRGDTRRTGRVVAEEGPGESLSVAWYLTAKEAVKAADDGISSDTERLIDGTSWPVLADESLIWMIRHHGGKESAFGTRLMAVDTSGSIEWSRKLSYMSGQATTRMCGPRIDDGLLYHLKPERLQVDSDADPDASPKTMVVTVRDPATGTIERELDLDVPAWGRILVEDGRIFVLTTLDEVGRLSAFDAESGAEEWSVETSWFLHYRSPFGSLFDDAILYFASRDGYLELIARNVDDGSVAWRTALDIPSPYWDAQSMTFYVPTVGDSVYVAGGSSAHWSHKLSPLVTIDKDDGTERSRYRPPGIERDDNPASNRSKARNRASEAVKASEELPPASGLYGMPLPIDDLVVATGYGAGENGGHSSRCFAIKDDSIEWSIESDMGSRVDDNDATAMGALVAAGDVIYLATGNGLKAISKEGDLLDSITYAEHEQLPASADTMYYGQMTPAIGNGLLYVPTYRGIAAIE